MKKIFVIIICSLSLVSWAQKKGIKIEKVSNIKTESFQVLANLFKIKAEIKSIQSNTKY